MRQPHNFVNPNFLDYVCKLRKAIYNLKQPPYAWFSNLSLKLFYLGYHECKSDPSLFSFRNTDLFLFVLVYVDDILIICSNS